MRRFLLCFCVSVIIINFCTGCSGEEVKNLTTQNQRLEQDIKAKDDRIKSLETQIKQLNDENLAHTEETSNLKRRLTDAGISENPDEDAFEACKENLKKISLGLRLYAADHNKTYPKKLSGISPNPKYLDYIPTCPAAKKDTYTSGYSAGADKKTYVVKCLGHNHESLRIKKNFPSFDSRYGLKVEREEAPKQED